MVTSATVLLCVSPECLPREPWKSVVVVLMSFTVLKLVCADEVRLFAMLRVAFRK